jgi:acyl-CoA reductase-like NAD-dependent aldehyde dehydrogenase
MSTTTLTEFPSHNPATGEVIGTYRNASVEDVNAAVVSERFALPFAFTTFKRTKFADKFLTSVIKFLH